MTLPITAALVQRLRLDDRLSDEDLRAIERLPVLIRQYRDNETVIRDGTHPTECCLIAEGFCVRSKTLNDGRRQVLSIHIPGDIPDLQSLHLPLMDHDLVAISTCTLAFIGHSKLKELARQRPAVGEAFWRDALSDAAVFREWIVNIGQRPASQRLAHILLELRERLRMVGRAEGDRFQMPLTQERLSEAMGITAVHANRIISQLRLDGIIDLQRGTATVLDEQKLQELADFDGRYLKLSSFAGST